MKKNGEAHAAEDKQKRELVEARNSAEALAYSTEKTLKEQGDKVSDSDRAPIEAAIEKVREAAKADDLAAIKSATDELQQATHAMSEAMYKSAADAAPGAAAAAGGDASSGDSGEEEAIDAEFEVKEG